MSFEASQTWAAQLTKDERSMLVYLESCAVDRGGIFESVRVNATDMVSFDRFKTLGWVEGGRVPAKLLPSEHGEYWVRLKPDGWVLASRLRYLRLLQQGPFATKVFAAVKGTE